MGRYDYPDEERTIHQERRGPSPTTKVFHRICMVLLFIWCLAVTGGIVLGLIVLATSVRPNVSHDDAPQVHNLLARSYYGNVTFSGSVGPTGTAPVSMNITASGDVDPTGTAPSSIISASGNIGSMGPFPISMNNVTVSMNTATGVPPSSPSPSLTLTVNGIDHAEPSSEAGASVVNATVTVTSTSTTVTNTRTVQAEDFTADAVESSSEGGNTGVIVIEPTDDCVPATVTLTVTKDDGNAPSAQTRSTSEAVTPLTTLVIPDLYSKDPKIGQSSQSTAALNATTETAVIQEASETPTASNNLTTVTVFERPTVMVTSTEIDNSPCMSENVTANGVPMATVTLSKVVTETYSTTLGGGAARTTGVRTVFETEVVGVETTVIASGTVGVFNNTSTALKTITVQPASATPEATESAASNGTSPVISEGTRLKLGKRGGGGTSGCVVMVVAAAIFCMLL